MERYKWFKNIIQIMDLNWNQFKQQGNLSLFKWRETLNLNLGITIQVPS